MGNNENMLRLIEFGERYDNFRTDIYCCVPGFGSGHGVACTQHLSVMLWKWCEIGTGKSRGGCGCSLDEEAAT